MIQLIFIKAEIKRKNAYMYEKISTLQVKQKTLSQIFELIFISHDFWQTKDLQKCSIKFVTPAFRAL